MKEIALVSSRTQKQIGLQALLAFGGAILIGALLLMIPQMTASGKISFIDALFTSTSAICVTGLIVQDTAKYFTDIGKTVTDFNPARRVGYNDGRFYFGLILGRKILIKTSSISIQALVPGKNLVQGDSS
jgi:trk system potassium uptake protein TrkH